MYFTTQLLELGIPVVVALNKQDLVRRHGNKINIEGLSKTLQCRVVAIMATEGEGLRELIKAVADAANEGKKQPASDFAGKGTKNENTARQKYVKEIVSKYLKKNRDPSQITKSDKIDRIVASPLSGLIIFAIVIWSVYSFSIEVLVDFIRIF